MNAAASTWMDSIATGLAERGYALGGSPVPGAILASKRVRNLGFFFPCSDFIFIHNLSAGTTLTSFEELHEQARHHAEAQFRLPRVLRYHIPNTVSVGVSDQGFSPADIEFAVASKLDSPLTGGQKHSTFLFDVGAKEMYSQGLEVTPGRYGSRVVSRVNPTNRSFDLMSEMLRELSRPEPRRSG